MSRQLPLNLQIVLDFFCIRILDDITFAPLSIYLGDPDTALDNVSVFPVPGYYTLSLFNAENIQAEIFFFRPLISWTCLLVD